LLDYLTELSRLAALREPNLDALAKACETVRHATGADDAYVLRAGDPHFVRVGDEGEPAEYEIKQRGYWLVWQHLAAMDATPVAVFSVEDRLVTRRDAWSAGRPGTHVACLLPYEESNSEMLVLRGPWSDGFPDDSHCFLEIARSILALLASKALDDTRQERQRQQLRSLTEVARAFSEASALENSLQAVATSLAKISGFDWVLVALTTPNGDEVIETALNLARHSNTATAAQRAPAGPELLRQLMEGRAPLLRGNVFDPSSRASEDELTYFERAHILSTATFPMFFQEDFLGFIRFSASVRKSFEPAEVAFLTDLVTQAATTLKGIRLYQELEEASRVQHFLARTDSLTGLPNRRYIEEVLRTECARAERQRQAVTVVMADLDYFKAVNDGQGHEAGDDLLRHVASLARASCREEVDFVGRWGGDEFVFILPATDLENGLDVADKFCAQLAKSPYRAIDGVWPVTASAGIAEAGAANCYDGPGLLRLADRALYQAKSGGRDRRVVADLNREAA
jgi:diguanylate cyclase (GGDEF)-like protein